MGNGCMLYTISHFKKYFSGKDGEKHVRFWGQINLCKSDLQFHFPTSKLCGRLFFALVLNFHPSCSISCSALRAFLPPPSCHHKQRNTETSLEQHQSHWKIFFRPLLYILICTRSFTWRIEGGFEWKSGKYLTKKHLAPFFPNSLARKSRKRIGKYKGDSLIKKLP